MIGSASTISLITLGILNHSLSVIKKLLYTSVNIYCFLNHERIHTKLNIRCSKLQDYINVIVLLYEKSWKQSMVDKKTDDKEALERKKIYNYYLDKKSDIMKNTQLKVQIVFGDFISKDSISPEQLTKLDNFLAKIM